MKRLIALMMALAIIASFAACSTKEDTTKEKDKEKENQSVGENVGKETETTPEAVTDETDPEGTEDTENVDEDATSENTDNNSGYTPELEIGETTTAVEVLDYAWYKMGAEHQPATYGGHISAEYMGGPYTYDLTYAEDLAATLLLPEDQMDKVVDAATVVHLLNANSMTAGVLKLQDGTDVQAFAKAISERISGNQWMCGFPEKMAIVQIDDNFLFVVYGLFELVDPIVNGLNENPNVSALYDQPLE